jgi:hypothetical protein
MLRLPDPGIMTRCCGKTTVAREQRGVERFRQCDVDGVVPLNCSVVPKYAEKHVMGCRVQRKVREIGNSRSATVTSPTANSQ